MSSGKIISIFPLLLRPKAQAVKNYFQRGRKDAGTRIRDSVVLLFALSVMLGIYRGGLWILNQAQADKHLVYLHPSVPLGLIFLYLLVMLVLSNSAAAVASLYMSNDLELVLASPLKPFRFFWGKFLDVMVGSSWITMIFIVPAIASFSSFYGVSFRYLLFMIVVLLPYFIIPAAASIIIVTIYARLVPANRTRETFFITVMLGTFGLYLLARLFFLRDGGVAFRTVEDVLRLVAILSVPNQIWVPSYWTSTCLAEYLVPTKPLFGPYLMLSYSVAIGLFGLAYLAFRHFHFSAYSKARSNPQTLRFRGDFLRRAVSYVFHGFSSAEQALIVKEYRNFSRDVSQLFQLMLLTGICAVYFYNFRIMHAIQAQLPEQSKGWWQLFLFLLNSYIEAFVITAVGTRFVFQSVSLEGRSFWNLAAAPISLQRFLRAKLLCWYVPMAIVLSTVFALGAVAVEASAAAVLIKFISSLAVCFGIVGLGVGLGAYFANFNWEHSSQLAASFGSLVYMLASVALISFDVALIGSPMLMKYHLSTFFDVGDVGLMVMYVGAIAILVIMNIAVTDRVLALGEKALEKRLAV